MSKERKPAGLILSAGLSSRMNDFKPLMKIGEKPAVQILIDSMKAAGLKEIFVVTGHNRTLLEDYLSDKEVTVVHNADYQEGMFTSVKAGVKAASEAGYDCMLMTPVDIPLIPPYVIKAVVNRYYDNEGHFAVACYGGKKGHPLCIPSAYADEILNDPGEQGMKSITSRHADEMIYVDTNCKSIIMDMDTQEAYSQMVEFFEANRYPTEEQCYRIYERLETPPHVIKHCEAVTDTAVAIAEALNRKGVYQNVDLVRAAGLLHDSLRVRKKHWDEAADLCIDYGYPEVADIIRVHMNYMHPDPVMGVNETDIICLADKLRQEDKLVTLEERLAPVRIRWKDNEEAMAVITERIRCADGMLKYIEGIIGEDIYEMLRRYDAEKLAARGDAGRHRRVILIRHGEIEKHSEKIFLGQTDVPMSDEGRDQLDHVGIEMKHFNIDSDTIYCSSLVRARESADIVASHLGGKKIVEIPEFMEMDLGSWDGLFISEIKERFPEEYRLRGEDLVNYRIGGTAESFADLRDRVMPAFRRLVAETEGDIVIVSHSGVNRIIKCAITGKPIEEVVKMKFGRGSYQIFDIREDQEFPL